MTKIIIKADNIKCGGCATNIKNGLSELPEVNSVGVNIESGNVTIEAGNIDKATLEQKLNDLGYPAKE